MKRKNNIRWIVFCIYCLILYSFLLFLCKIAYSGCYIDIKGSINYSEDLSFSKIIFNEYIEKVIDIPIQGIKYNSCLYSINVFYSNDKTRININGPRNFISESVNFKTALLLSILKNNKKDICNKYSYLLNYECDIYINHVFIDIYGDITDDLSKGFRIALIPKSDLYTYLINKDINGKTKIIFPNDDSVNQLNKENIYIFPTIDSNEYFYSKDIKNEKVYLVFSLQPINDIRFLDDSFKKRGIFKKTLIDFERQQ